MCVYVYEKHKYLHIHKHKHHSPQMSGQIRVNSF